MANTTINGGDVQSMVTHWLKTPTNAYLGSSYGQDINSLLHRPQADGAPETLLEKLRADVPVLQALPSGAVNLYAVQTPPDKLDLVIEVAGQAIAVPEAR